MAASVIRCRQGKQSSGAMVPVVPLDDHVDPPHDSGKIGKSNVG